jgi:hypothetical protein
LGEFESCGYGKDGFEWDKDICVAESAETRYGIVKFYYYEEDETNSGRGAAAKGVWTNFYKSIDF